MKNYLILPINNNKELKDVVLVSKTGINYGLSVRLDAVDPKYYVYIDVTFLDEIETVNLKENEYNAKLQQLINEEEKINFLNELGIAESGLDKLIKACMNILSDRPLFFLINSYTTGISAKVLENKRQQ